jgi:hypothetical protein
MMVKRLQLLKSERLRPARPWGRALVIWWIVALTLTALSLSAATFTAALDRNTITMGDSVTLTLTVADGTPDGFPALPPIPNLQAGAEGESRQVRFDNGEMSATVSHTYSLTPLQPGDYTIPVLAAVIGGQTYRTPPITLKVLKAGAPMPGTDGDNTQLSILKLVLPKTEVYVGEVMQGELDLYLRDGVVNMRNFQVTPMQAEGFTVGKMAESQQRRAAINGVGYTVVPLTIPFTAVKAGTLTLGPAQCTAELLLGPMNWFNQPTRSQQVSPQSDTVTIAVKPLPKENVPPGFNGAVGNLSLNVEVSPTNVAVGDPITVKVQISGQGGVEAITLPDEPGWEQFKSYPPTSEFQPSDQSGMSGTKSFALTVVPQSLEIKELPPFVFSYFDPNQKAYRTLSQPAVPLTVRPSAASLPMGVSIDAGTTAPASTNQDIVHIKPRVGTLAAIQPPLVMRPWFVALQGLPVLAWVSLWFRRKQAEKLANNPRLRRLRKSELAIRTRLRELRQAADRNARDEFFAALFRLLQEQLGARLDLPASAITEAVVEERLGPPQVTEEIRSLVRELFQACNQARYARQETNDDLVALVPKVEAALKGLRVGMA